MPPETAELPISPGMRDKKATREGCAVVTGSSRGIGAATALALARDGWPVRVNYRADEEGAREVAARIAAEGGVATVHQGDVGDPEQVASLLEPGEHGPVLVLVNNAGLRLDGLSPQLDDEQRFESDTGTEVTANAAANPNSVAPEILHRQRKTRYETGMRGEPPRDRTSQELAKLYRLAMQMGTESDSKRLAEVVLDGLLASTPADMGAILLLDPSDTARPEPERLSLLAYKSLAERPTTPLGAFVVCTKPVKSRRPAPSAAVSSICCAR